MTHKRTLIIHTVLTSALIFGMAPLQSAEASDDQHLKVRIPNIASLQQPPSSSMLLGIAADASKNYLLGGSGKETSKNTSPIEQNSIVSALNDGGEAHGNTKGSLDMPSIATTPEKKKIDIIQSNRSPEKEKKKTPESNRKHTQKSEPKVVIISGYSHAWDTEKDVIINTVDAAPTLSVHVNTLEAMPEDITSAKPSTTTQNFAELVMDAVERDVSAPAIIVNPTSSTRVATNNIPSPTSKDPMILAQLMPAAGGTTADTQSGSPAPIISNVPMITLPDIDAPAPKPTPANVAPITPTQAPTPPAAQPTPAEAIVPTDKPLIALPDVKIELSKPSAEQAVKKPETPPAAEPQPSSALPATNLLTQAPAIQGAPSAEKTPAAEATPTASLPQPVSQPAVTITGPATTIPENSPLPTPAPAATVTTPSTITPAATLLTPDPANSALSQPPAKLPELSYNTNTSNGSATTTQENTKAKPKKADKKPTQKTLKKEEVTPPPAVKSEGEPEDSLSAGSRKMLKTLKAPAQPKTNTVPDLDINRTRDMHDLFKAGDIGTPAPQRDSLGIKIEMKRPTINVDYELEKAYNALNSGQTDIAIQTYKSVLQNNPDNQTALFGLATVYHRARQFDLARPLYSRLLNINPNHRDGFNNFLVLLADEAPQEALKEMEILEQKNPGFSPIPAQIAVIYQKIGDKDKATQKMLRAVALSPENLTYRYNLAIMMDKQKNYDEAAKLYRQLLEAASRGEKIPGKYIKYSAKINFYQF